MTDIVLTGLTLAVLLAAYPLMILADLRHPAPAAPVTDHGGSMTAQGVPYVPGGAVKS